MTPAAIIALLPSVLQFIEGVGEFVGAQDGVTAEELGRMDESIERTHKRIRALYEKARQEEESG